MGRIRTTVSDTIQYRKRNDLNKGDYTSKHKTFLDFGRVFLFRFVNFSVFHYKSYIHK